MGTAGPWDDLDLMLAGLQAHDASPERIERIRVKAVTALERRRMRAFASRCRAWRDRLEPALVLAMSALYLAAALAVTLQAL